MKQEQAVPARRAARGGLEQETDASLLRRFGSERDQAAFALLLRRHGPMVWGVCRRLLADWHDAEDAYQAVFIVLARKANAVGWSDSIANWLYGVAHRVGLKARAAAIKRAARQKAAQTQARQATVAETATDAGQLDEELNRLPAKYREPLVLCCLEGLSNEEAARQLGRPVGTIWYQLSRGREMLRQRLARRGMVLSAAAVTAALTPTLASAAVPAALVQSTLQVAVMTAAGSASAKAVSATAVVLAQQVLHGMLWAKVKTSAAVAIGVALALLTAGVALSPRAAQPTTADAPPAQAVVPGSGRIVGYYPEWGIYDRKFNVADVQAAKLTHLNYAFAKIENGVCALFDPFAAVDKAFPGDVQDAGALRGNLHQLQLLKQRHPHLKTMISVGGWTLSGPFSDVAATEEARVKFARSCVAFMKRYDFDGLDIDWEYPVSGGLEGNKTRPEDKANYTKLLAVLRAELDQQGKQDDKRYLLTIAAPAAPATYANLELERITPLLDWYNLMTYDFHGGWSKLTNFQSALYASKNDPTAEPGRTKFNLDAAVQGYRAAGVPADKIVVGVPFYGRGWGGMPDKDRGLYQPPAADLPKGTWEPGTWDYKDLAANYVGKMQRHWHDDAQVPWLFDPARGLMITYEDAQSLKVKTEYVNRHGLGGVMIWELSGDDAQGTLLKAIHGTLKRKE